MITHKLQGKIPITISTTLFSTVENMCFSNVNFINNECQQAFTRDKELKEKIRNKIERISNKYKTTACSLVNRIKKIEKELEIQTTLKTKILDFLYKIGFDAFSVGVITAIASLVLFTVGAFSVFTLSTFGAPIATLMFTLYAGGVLCLGTFSVAAIIEAVGGIFVLLANVLRDPKVKKIRKDLKISKKLLWCAKRNSTLFHQLSINLTYLLNPKSAEILNNNYFKFYLYERENYKYDPERYFTEIFNHNCGIPFKINSTQMINYSYDPESPIDKIKNLIIEKSLYQKTRKSIIATLITKISGRIFFRFQKQYTVPTTAKQFHKMDTKEIIEKIITKYVKKYFNDRKDSNILPGF